MRRVALLFSALAAVAFLFSPHPVSTVVKGLSVSLLALVALGSGRRLLASALLLSSAGDVVLDLDARLFVLGLVAFLAAHIVYVALFVRHRRATRSTDGRHAVLVALVVYGLIFGCWLWPGLGDLRMPVVVYMTAILAMVWTATRAGYRGYWVVAGALLFLLSDSILGASRFRVEIPGHSWLTWVTYYAGQRLLATEGDGTRLLN